MRRTRRGRLWPPAAFCRRGCSAQAGAPPVITSERMRPRLPCDVQSGDLAGDRAIIWARADRPARMMVEWATTESFREARLVRGPAALEDSDFTAKVDLAGLPPGERVFYRVVMVDLTDHKLASEPVTGSLWTPPAARRDIRFVWSGDTAGQGWGINPDWGGMKIYETMRQVEPAFFIHSGDAIYADGPIAAEQAMPDGGIWRNLTTEAKAKVAETLAEFRGNYVYNLMDGTSGASTPRCRCSPMGRPRRHRQLVPARGSRRRTRKGRVQGDQRRSAGGARRAGIHGVPAGAPASARSGAAVRGVRLWPRARRFPHRHALLSRSQHARTSRPSRAPTRRSSGPSRSAG